MLELSMMESNVQNNEQDTEITEWIRDTEEHRISEKTGDSCQCRLSKVYRRFWKIFCIQSDK